MNEKENYSHFDMRAFRGHFRIAAGHFDGMCDQFERLETLYKKSVSNNEKLTTENARLTAEVEAAKRLLDAAILIDLNIDKTIAQMPDDTWVESNDLGQATEPIIRYDSALDAFTALEVTKEQDSNDD